MTSYLSKYVGVDQLPRRLSDFDIQQFFRLPPNDVLAIKERFRADRRVGPAIQLVFLRATGRQLDRFTVVPPPLLKSLGDALGVRVPTVASLKAIYKRRETLNDHQIWARQHLGLAVASKERLSELSAYLDLSASQAIGVDELVSMAKHRLFEEKILIPADRTLRDLARGAFSQIEQIAIDTIHKAISAQEIQACQSAFFLRRESSSPTTVLEWLKTPPKRHSPSTLNETLEKIRYLQKLGVHSWAIDGISLERQRAHSQALVNRPPSESRRRVDSTQILEMVCFLRVTLLELTDSVPVNLRVPLTEARTGRPLGQGCVALHF